MRGKQMTKRMKIVAGLIGGMLLAIGTVNLLLSLITWDGMGTKDLVVSVMDASTHDPVAKAQVMFIYSALGKKTTSSAEINYSPMDIEALEHQRLSAKTDTDGKCTVRGYFRAGGSCDIKGYNGAFAIDGEVEVMKHGYQRTRVPLAKLLPKSGYSLRHSPLKVIVYLERKPDDKNDRSDIVPIELPQ